MTSTDRIQLWKGGIKSVLGCNYKALAFFRISLGFLLLMELLLRFRFLHVFYSDEGTLPLKILLPKIETLYRLICIHTYSGSLVYQQIMLSVQVLFAFFLIIGYKCSLSAVISWFLYLSLTLRNTWLNFILDRYFHYMLFYSMFLPIGGCFSVDSYLRTKKKYKVSDLTMHPNGTVVTIATIAIKAQVLWIYLDAGYGKYSDPLGGWTYNADPLPALDTYARHTLVARYLYALLTPKGLRIMTPMVVYLELFSVPITLLGSYFGNRKVVNGMIALICSLHVGIALTVRNTILLSSVACAAWCVFLAPNPQEINNIQAKFEDSRLRRMSFISILKGSMIISMILGNIWFETVSGECNQSMKHIWSTLLHNRWNVFIGAEEYVTWEIAPGRLANGKVVDVWGRIDDVNWNMPTGGAPCTSTSRPGRWRSFPYLAELEGEEGEALWSYLCKQWDNENGVNKGNPGRKLLRYNFFMLQADVLPNMGFTATRKRLIHSHDCTKTLASIPTEENSEVRTTDEF